MCPSALAAQRWVECIQAQKDHFAQYPSLDAASDYFDTSLATVERVLADAHKRSVLIKETVAALVVAVQGEKEFANSTRLVNPDQLRNAVAAGRELSDVPSVAKELPRAANLLSRVSEVENEARKAIRMVDHWALRDAVTKAKKVHMKSEIVSQAAFLSRQIGDLNACLKLARQRVNIRALKLYVFEADGILLRSKEVKHAKDLIDLVDSFHRWADRAIGDCDASALTSVVAEAKVKDVNTPKIERCRLLLKRIQLLEQEELRAEDTLITSHMEAVVNAADRIGYSSGVTERLRTILALPEAERLDLQMRRALERGEIARWRRICKHLKELFYAEHGDAYSILNYPGLKNPQEWASEKRDCSRGERHRLAASFMSFQSSSIHSSLTRLPEVAGDSTSTFQIDAKYLFRCIRELMGERKLKGDPMEKARELIEMCCKSELLRAECFCQIIKQTRTNPQGPESLENAWDLLKLCVASFPPPNDFEEYIEYTLREHSPDCRRYVTLLHDTLFSPVDQSSGASGAAGNASTTNATKFPVPTVAELYALLDDENSETTNSSETLPGDDARRDNACAVLSAPYDRELGPHVEEDYY